MVTDMLFALYVIKIYDGQTFTVLGQQRATLDENHFSSIHGPFRQLTPISRSRSRARCPVRR